MRKKVNMSLFQSSLLQLNVSSSSLISSLLPTSCSFGLTFIRESHSSCGIKQRYSLRIVIASLLLLLFSVCLLLTPLPFICMMRKQFNLLASFNVPNVLVLCLVHCLKVSTNLCLSWIFHLTCLAVLHAVCDGTFFPSLLQEMSAVVGCFNERAQKLVDLHLASGFRKYFKWFRSKSHRNHGALIQEGQDLVTYAIINSIAMRKILKKYDKIHYSKQGQAFKSQAPHMHIEILQSPWLCELMAFYINMREMKLNISAIPGLFGDCSLKFEDEKPLLSCVLFDAMKLDIDLTCSICLDTVFDPVSLTCGHIFCYMCCCSAASSTTVDGLKSANPKTKCPLCRQKGVYQGAVHLDELNILLSRSCSDYWEERLQRERRERIQQAKEHWESQCRSFMGI